MKRPTLVKYLKEVKIGERVTLITVPSAPASFPARLVGKTGIVIGKRGRAYVISLLDGKKRKTFIVKAVHLKLAK